MKKHEIITALEESGLPSDKIDELMLALEYKDLRDLPVLKDEDLRKVVIESTPSGEAWRSLAAEAAKRIGEGIDA